jgi:hypothetical protein
LKKLAFLAATIGLGAAALLVARQSQAADHLDAPAVRLSANVMADIGDVYAWMTADGKSVNLAMTVSPNDDGTHPFGSSFQYVFHVNSYVGALNSDAYGTDGAETRVICTFANASQGQCWVAAGNTAKDYVTGDPSSNNGVTSRSGKVKLFAGRRSDPFFFNLAGFIQARTTVEGACGVAACPGALVTDAAGCPTITSTTAGVLRTQLSTVSTTAQGPCPANQIDCFLNFNVMAIVLQVDKNLLNAGPNHLLSVWGSTHMTP